MLPRRNEAGMTVLELMIAMLIMIIITVPLVSSFVLGMKSTTEGRQEVTSSADAQIIATYFDTDVAGAETVRTTSGASCSIPGGSPVLTLESNDSGSLVRVTYATVPASTEDKVDAGLPTTATMYYVQRARCVGAGAGTPVTVARQVLATRVECDGTTSCGAIPPRTVTLLVEEASRYLPDKNSPDRFTVAVTAVRKVTP